MIQNRLLNVLLTCICASVLCQALSAQDDPGPNSIPDPVQLTEDRFAEFRDYIRPSGQELQFIEVGWRPTLWQARREAQKKNKPLLIWVMNGHPLGHT